MTELAPHGNEHVVLNPTSAESSTWWEAYAASLEETGIGATSRGVIDDDASFIVQRGVFGHGAPLEGKWPESRERTGLVMGAVQSGKTASMMAVTAKALDQGVDAVIILGGTRTALWKQTYERVVEQLDFATGAHLRRVLVPTDASSDGATAFLQNLYRVSEQKARRAIERKRPILAVVMKHVAHLEQLALMMHGVIYPLVAQRGEPFHVLVIDDEADDSSVVDARAEAGDDVLVRRKQVPRRIVDIWEARHKPGTTANDHVFATYLAYTATPQANFLQDESNPLAPRDFVASLRTPGVDGVPAIRTSNYRVPEGISGWYTGGEIFYKTLSSVPLCRPTDQSADEDLVPQAVRAFLVASAIRLLRDTSRLGPRSASQTTFRTKAQVKQKAPEVASMLIHPSSAKDDHFTVANELLSWAAGTGRGVLQEQADTNRADRTLGSAGILRDMIEDEAKWTYWLDEYRRSAEKTVHSYPDAVPRATPSEWPVVRTLILEEIIPGTSVAVINSDEDADDRPRFSPSFDGSVWRAPRNLSTIFVSGNVMSRGLTLEGLTTTLFTRTSNSPVADTQMQMQRWFGYRGKYIDLCRVFMPEGQVEAFFRYHQDEEALRRDVLKKMEADGELPNISVLQGRAYKATGKISGLRGVPLFPGAKPFVRHVNSPEADEANQQLIRDLFVGESLQVGTAPNLRGLLLPEPLTLSETADLLDRLRYPDHGRNPDGPEASRWRSVESHAWIAAGDPILPLYRAPLVPAGVDLGAHSPYAIAAYLRFWDACLIRHVPGVSTTDDPPATWNLLDLEVLRERQPKFWIGLRFGAGAPLADGPLADLPVPVRPVQRALSARGILESTWGSRNEIDGVIRGDEVFDYQALGLQPDATPTGARQAGSDGLILFHPVDRGAGKVSVTLGASIPLGGPDHIRASRGRSDA